MKIEDQMDEARVPIAAQKMQVTDYEYCDDLRHHIENLREAGPTGVNFVIANVCNNQDETMPITRLTPMESRMLVWTFVKELILSHQRIKVMNPVHLAEQLCKVKAWDEEFQPDYADHLILTNFYRSGQESPYSPKELGRLVDYLGERYEYGKATHTYWEMVEQNNFGNEAMTWYPRLWVDWWFDENTTKWIERR